MAIYVPVARRRRRVLVVAVAALCVGVLIGVLVGRNSVPSVNSRIATVQKDAQTTAAGLRVLALHNQAGVSTGSSDEIDLVLSRTEAELRREFKRAPWVTTATQLELIAKINTLRAATDRTSADFGSSVEALAKSIETTFGLS